MSHNTNACWVLEHVRKIWFQIWLKDARDWDISCSRFWGTPLSIWTNKDKSEMIHMGNISQLIELTRTKVMDLHSEFIEELEIPSSKNLNGLQLKHVNKVFDCWFELGSMSHAQKHICLKTRRPLKMDSPPTSLWKVFGPNQWLVLHPHDLVDYPLWKASNEQCHCQWDCLG